MELLTGTRRGRHQRRRARHRDQRRGDRHRQHPRGREDPRLRPRRLRRLGGDRRHRSGAGPPRLRRPRADRRGRRRDPRRAGELSSERWRRRCSPSPTSPRDATRSGSPRSRGAFSDGVALLDSHSDADHNRTVFTLAGEQRGAARGAGARRRQAAVESIDMTAHEGVHPAIGALDVCPIVWLDADGRDAARTAALETAERSPPSACPVFLYGAHGDRPRARRAGLLSQRRPRRAVAADGGGRAAPRPRPGAAPPHAPAPPWSPPARRSPPSTSSSTAATSSSARAVAAGLRESGGGLPGVRAIGLPLGSGRTPGLDQRPRPGRDAARRGGRAGPRAGRAARRPAGRGRAGRSGSRGGARRLSRRRADPRLRPGPADDRAAARGARPEPPAPTRFASWPRRGRSAAASTAAPRAGASTPAGAPAVPRSREEAKAPRPRRGRKAPATRHDSPPTWRSAIVRGLVAAVALHRPAPAALRAPGRRGARPRRLHARLLHPGRLLHRHDDVAAARAGPDPRRRRTS